MVETIAVPKASLKTAALNAQQSIGASYESDREYSAASISEAITSAMWTLARTGNTGGQFVSVEVDAATTLAAFTNDLESSGTISDMLYHYGVWE